MKFKPADTEQAAFGATQRVEESEAGGNIFEDIQGSGGNFSIVEL
jgi:hypothetical protein